MYLTTVNTQKNIFKFIRWVEAEEDRPAYGLWTCYICDEQKKSNKYNEVDNFYQDENFSLNLDQTDPSNF